ncbi:MAG: restriction endonuclease [Clostridium sp.]|nr:restriction endonuclease [Clostridium sp.]
MTIVQAIIKVLEKEDRNLTSEEIYNKVIEKQLYTFGTKDPKAIVNGTIRRHSIGIEFSTASPIKYFTACAKRNGKTTFKLKGEDIVAPVNIRIQGNEKDILPEEIIQASYEKYKKLIQDTLLDRVLASDSAFFEKLVVELLIKMGYGGSDPKSGFVTPRSNDGGIDGVINEDKLGLDKIYIQAKRYAVDNRIDRPKLQQFVGAIGKCTKRSFYNYI